MKKLLLIASLTLPLAALAQLPTNPAPALNETNQFTGLTRWQRVTNIVDANLSAEGVPRVHVGHTHTYERVVEVTRELVVDYRVGTNIVRGFVLKSVPMRTVRQRYTVPLTPTVTTNIVELEE